MAPNLVKSASLCSMDTSIHCLVALAPQAQTAVQASPYAPLTDSLTIPQDNYNYHDDYNHEDSVFGFGSKLGSNSRSTLRRTPSMLYQIIVEDEAKKAVSCERIETNLITDANKRNDAEAEIVVNQNKAEQESYWDMPSEEYYNDQDGDQIDVIDDVATLSTSTQQVERLLVEDALRRAEKQAMETVVNGHPNNAYWDWPSEAVLESEKRSNLIASIVLEEAIRQKLSIASITDIEVQASSKNQQVQDSDNYSPNVESASMEDVSVDYWSWNADEEEAKKQEEKSEDVVAPHVHDASHPNHAYWDFPSQVNGPEDLKKQLIDKILKDERIRDILSSAAVTEREINFHRSRQQQRANKNTATMREIPAPKSVLSSVPADYWDFSSEEGFLTLVTSEKQQLINKILKEEEQRYVLSTENIENNLNVHEHNVGATQQSQSDSSPITPYWDW